MRKTISSVAAMALLALASVGADEAYQRRFHVVPIGIETLKLRVGVGMYKGSVLQERTMKIADARKWCYTRSQCGGFTFKGNVNTKTARVAFHTPGTIYHQKPTYSTYTKYVPHNVDPQLKEHTLEIPLTNNYKNACGSRNDVSMAALVYCKVMTYDYKGKELGLAWSKDRGGRECYNTTGGHKKPIHAGHQWSREPHLELGWQIKPNGDLKSTDDDLAFLNVMALRFKNIGIPKGADITYASIGMFTHRADLESGGDIRISTEDSSNAKCFDTQNWMARGYDGKEKLAIPRTAASTVWKPTSNCIAHPEMCIEKGEFLQTPDLSHIIQPLVERSDWTKKSPVSFVLQPNDLKPLKEGQIPTPCEAKSCRTKDGKPIPGKCTYCNGYVKGMYRLSTYAWDKDGAVDTYKVPHLTIKYTTGCTITCRWVKNHMEVFHPWRSRGKYHCRHNKKTGECSCTCDRNSHKFHTATLPGLKPTYIHDAHHREILDNKLTGLKPAL